MTATWSPVLTPESVTIPDEIIQPLAGRYLGAATTGTFTLVKADIEYLAGARDFSNGIVRDGLMALIDAVSIYGQIRIVIE